MYVCMYTSTIKSPSAVQMSKSIKQTQYIYTRVIVNDIALFKWRNTYILSKTTTDDFSSYDVHTNAIRHPQERRIIFLWQSADILR